MSPCRLPTAEVWDRHAAPHPGIETSERCPRAERQHWPTCLRGWQFPGSRPVAWGARPGRDRLRPAPARPPSRPELTQPAPLACSPSVVDGHAGPVGITHRPVPRLQRPTARFRECSSASGEGGAFGFHKCNVAQFQPLCISRWDARWHQMDFMWQARRRRPRAAHPKPVLFIPGPPRH